MTFVKLDDGFPNHPKAVHLPVSAKWLYIEGLCYASRYTTDGWIPAAVVKQLGSLRAAGMLVDARLWDEKPNGWQVHNYLERQTSKAEIDSKRESKRIAGAKGAAVRWGMANGMAKNSQKTEDRKQKTETDPSSSSARETVTKSERRSMKAVEDLMGALNKPVLDAIHEFCEAHVGDAGEWVEEACKEAALSNARSWNYVSAILGRWKREGFKAERGSHGTTNGASGKHGAVRAGDGGYQRQGSGVPGQRPADPRDKW